MFCNALEIILNQVDLVIEEKDLYKHVVRWAKAECQRKSVDVTNANIRLVLGEKLYLIRFPVFDMVDFADGPATDGILNQDEITDIFMCFAKSKTHKSRFSSAERVSGDVFTCSRFGGVDTIYPLRNLPRSHDAIDFSVNHFIRITGIGLYGSRNGSSVEAQICIRQEGSILLCMLCTYKGDDRLPAVVKFDKAVSINPDKIYTIDVELKGLFRCDTYRGIGGKKEVMVGGVKFKFRESALVTLCNNTGVCKGQIPDITFLY